MNCQGEVILVNIQRFVDGILCDTMHTTIRVDNGDDYVPNESEIMQRFQAVVDSFEFQEAVES